MWVDSAKVLGWSVVFISNNARPQVVFDTWKERRTTTRSVGVVKAGKRELVVDRSVAPWVWRKGKRVWVMSWAVGLKMV